MIKEIRMSGLTWTDEFWVDRKVSHGAQAEGRHGEVDKSWVSSVNQMGVEFMKNSAKGKI